MFQSSNIEESQLFRSVSPEEWAMAEGKYVSRDIKKGGIIRFHQLKYVYFLQSGVVKVVTSDEQERELVRGIISPGLLFGVIPLLELTDRPDTYAKALIDAVIVQIEVDLMNRWLHEHEELRRLVRKEVGQKIINLEDRLLAVLYKSAYQRITDFIVELVKDFGRRTDEHTEIHNFLYHEDIAQMTATSRQTVSQVLNELREKGWLDYDKKSMRIPNTSPLLEKQPNATSIISHQ